MTEEATTNGIMSRPRSGKYAFFGLPEYDVTKCEGVITKHQNEFHDEHEMKVFIMAFKSVARKNHARRFRGITVKKPTKDDNVLRLWSSVGVTLDDVEREIPKVWR